MTSVEERGGVVVVEVAGAERRQTSQMVLGPLPDVASGVVKPESVRRKLINRLHTHTHTHTHTFIPFIHIR